MSAYNVLRKQGRLSAEVGSGTYVVVPSPDAQVGAARPERPPGVISLSGSAPASLEAEVGEALRAASLDMGWLASGMVTLGSPQGLAPLRRAVAESYARRGLPTSEREVLITSGAQQALALIARTLVDAGDVVVCESPTYHGAVDAFASRGARFGWADAGDGAGLAARAEAENAGLIYSIPACHYVTGVGMARDGRRSLLRFAADPERVVIDDDILAGLVLRGDVAPLAAEDGDANVVTLGSMSKVFLPGLRVGWLRAEEPTVARLVREKAVEDQGTSIVTQVVSLQLLGERERVERLRREEMETCSRLATSEIRRRLPDWTFTEPEGGRSLWAHIDGVATAFAQVALHHGVAVTPSAMLGPTDHDDHVRVVFVQPPDIIVEGISRLALAWARLRGRDGPDHRRWEPGAARCPLSPARVTARHPADAGP